MSERFEHAAHDFSRINVMYDVFASGDASAIEQMRIANGWTEDEVVVYEHYANLRVRLRRQADEEARERMEKRPVASPVELMMGTYIEQVEPHVRNAVRVLYDKGYGTISSGFYGLNAQEMKFAGQGLGDWWFDDAFIDELLGRGVAVKRVGNWMLLELHEMFTSEELVALWNEIVDHIPESGHAPDVSGNGNARRFREAQRTLRQMIHIRSVAGDVDSSG